MLKVGTPEPASPYLSLDVASGLRAVREYVNSLIID